MQCGSCAAQAVGQVTPIAQMLILAALAAAATLASKMGKKK